MPKNQEDKWQEVKLGDFLIINPSEKFPKYTIAKKVSMEKLQPFSRDVSGYELDEFSGGAKFRNKDTIMARITPCLENGKRAQINILKQGEVGFGSTEFIVFREKDNISDANFIYYLVCSDLIRSPAIKSMVGSSGRQRVQTDVLENLCLFLPPLEVQKKIAGVLGALDDKIELNNKINQNLEAQAQALFKSWFVDQKKSERKTISADELFEISIGKTPPRKEPEWFSKNSKDITWASISDMGNCGTYILNSSEFLTKEAVSKFNIKIVPENTMILSFKLTVGRIAITDKPITTNEAIAHFVTKDKTINEYLYCYLKNFNFQTMGSTSSIATAVNSKIIKKMPFVLPTNSEQENFHMVTAPMFAQIRKNQKENLQLVELRDTLLPKLMSGEINVDDVKID